MLRRNSAWGFAFLGVASLLLFIPLAAASSSDRPVQTLTLLALGCALAACGLTCLAIRRRGLLASTYLGLAALAGALSAVWLLRMIPDLPPSRVSELASRLFVIAAFDGVGVWLFVVGLRRVFPRRVRGLGATAITLLLVGLLAGPSLLLQPGAAFLNLTDVQTQLRAGFLYWTVGATLMVAPFLALMTLPGDWFERWWAAASSRFMAIPNRAFAIALAVAVLALAAFFATYSFDRRPTTADEIAQLWHARMLLDGRLAMPPDPNAEFFAIDNIVDRPRWMSQFPIGGPAVLAIGMLAGAVWLLNPILTALMALNVYRFAQRVYGEPQARAAAVVVASSPMVLMMGGTHMNHTPTAFLVTLALATLPLWESASGPAELRRTAAVIGTSIGAAFAIRPLDGLIAGLALGLSMLWLAARGRNGARARSLLVVAAVGAIPVVLLLVANWKTTGHPLRFGYEVLWGSQHSLGLHDDPMGNPHTPWRALLLAVKYTVQLNWIATAWPVPVLLIVAGGLVLARRPHRWDVLLLSLFGAQLLVYAFYWHDGQFIGPRFLFTVVPALLILAARAPFVVAERARGVWWRIAVIIVPVCMGIAWLRTMRPFGVQSLAMEFRESRRRLKQDPPKEVRDGTVQNALIFVQEGASTRLLHRLWGVGVSRPDAARLLQEADACTLLEAIRSEERRPAMDTSGRVRRIALSTRPFVRSGANIPVADVNFRITDNNSLTQACADEVAHDHRVLNTVAYGSMLLFNRFDESGRIGGPVVYVMDLRDHNEVLRQRFGNRRWYRYEVPRRLADTLPVLVPYDSAR